MNISHPLIHDADTHGLLGQLARFVDTAKGKVLCYESLLFHMQVLKRGLFQSASGLADETDAVVITSAGLIPYRISNSLMTIQGRDQQYCLRYDSKLLHCECILPASSIHVTVSTEQRKQADEQAESPHSTRVVFAPALPFPLTVYGTANSCIVSISPPSCSSSIIRTPFLFNVYLDQIRAKGKTGVDIWTMKLSLTPASSVVVLFSQGDKDINELVGKLDRVDDGLVVLVQSTTVILQHLLRYG
ncbi:hypothetical protein EON65_20835 [archaeon]|nr:MAG: hypothetical protein EON65_20835 [archaeon]